jgi:Flp pilus assembly protein TadB
MSSGQQKCAKCGAVFALDGLAEMACPYCGTPFAAPAASAILEDSARARRESAMAESIALGKEAEQKLKDLDSISYSEHGVQKGLRRFWGPLALLAAAAAALAYANQSLVCAVPLAILAAFALLVWLAANPKSDKNSTRRALLKEELEYLKTRRETLRAELDDLQSLSAKIAVGQSSAQSDLDDPENLKGNI